MDLLKVIRARRSFKRIAMGVALGYRDWDYPVNQFERGRGKLEEFVTWAS